MSLWAALRFAGPPPLARGVSTRARLVVTHSSYIDGLVESLERLAVQPGIRCIVPGRIARCRSGNPRQPMRISTQTKNGHKLLARRGSLVQEVFVVTELASCELMAAIERANS